LNEKEEQKQSGNEKEDENFPSYSSNATESRDGQTSASDVWTGWSVLKIKNKILK
jgi:hypothetical protein